LAASPIAEEEADVESSPSPLNLEVLSSKQRPASHVEDLGQDHQIVAVTQSNVDIGSKFDLGNLLRDAKLVVDVQSNVAISQEELDQLEKDNPLEAFDFLIKSNALFLEVLESLQMFPLMTPQSLLGIAFWQSFEAKFWA